MLRRCILLGALLLVARPLLAQHGYSSGTACDPAVPTPRAVLALGDGGRERVAGVIGFAGDPNFRELWRGLLPLFANDVLLGASF